MDEAPVICRRCGAELEAGKDHFYVVRIEAFADPTPPNITADDLERDRAAEIDRLVEALGGISAQEAQEQVYRRMTLHLCCACYREWIENPTG